MKTTFIVIAVIISVMMTGISNVATATNDDGNIKEVGTEAVDIYGYDCNNEHGLWYNDPDEGGWCMENLPSGGWLMPCKDSAGGFINRLQGDGWTKRFQYGDSSAWEEDFKKSSLGGTDNYYIDTVDFAYFCGHGKKTGFYFNNDYDDKKLRSSNTAGVYEAEWGDKDLEWMALDACNVLEFDNWNVFSRWGWPVFKGQHQILGFATKVDARGDKGYKFGEYLVQGYTIADAWFKMCSEKTPGRTAAVMYVANEDSTNSLNDHLPGHGSIASDNPNPSLLGWYFYNC